MTATIEIEGLKELESALTQYPKIAIEEMETGMRDVVNHVAGRWSAYPTQIKGRPQPFVSEKQRRYFFWALGEGKIQVPYRRTGTLGRKIVADNRVELAPEGIRGVIPVNLEYARYVVGEEQSRFHEAGGWRKGVAVVRQEMAAIRGIVLETGRRIMARIAEMAR